MNPDFEIIFSSFQIRFLAKRVPLLKGGTKRSTLVHYTRFGKECLQEREESKKKFHLDPAGRN
ncbi:MAG: hypothetical protein C0407_01690 [Desulfobacca sp.]|nr:hypothetical protein [Desulfobacca sp.]